MVWEKLAMNVVMNSIENNVTVKEAMKGQDEAFQVSILGKINNMKNA